MTSLKPNFWNMHLERYRWTPVIVSVCLPLKLTLYIASGREANFPIYIDVVFPIITYSPNQGHDT